VVASNISRNLWCKIYRNIYCSGIVVNYEFIPEGKTVKKEMYTNILRRLRDAVRRNAPKNEESKGGFFFTTMLQHTGRVWSRVS
jgi:hypothetical protein